MTRLLVNIPNAVRKQAMEMAYPIPCLTVGFGKANTPWSMLCTSVRSITQPRRAVL